MVAKREGRERIASDSDDDAIARLRKLARPSSHAAKGAVLRASGLAKLLGCSLDAIAKLVEISALPPPFVSETGAVFWRANPYVGHPKPEPDDLVGAGYVDPLALPAQVFPLLDFLGYTRRKTPPEAPTAKLFGAISANIDQSIEMTSRRLREEFVRSSIEKLSDSQLTAIFGMIKAVVDDTVINDGLLRARRKLWRDRSDEVRSGAGYQSPSAFIEQEYGAEMRDRAVHEDDIAEVDLELITAYKQRVAKYQSEKLINLLPPRTEAERLFRRLRGIVSEEDVVRAVRAHLRKSARTRTPHRGNAIREK